MSMCDSCMRPGYCCNDMYLSGGWDEARFELPMSFESAEHLAMEERLPFRPLRQDENGIWRWWCPNLGRDGRCTDYENRPKLCRDYRPGEDRLCYHYVERE